ncbi:DUF11 domain-containing protein [Microbacterium resistens]|uniref:DUF7927 domain-containing protein n=1 Tax=Microbacterium resistens TaxID=156977 RepID=UPI001C58F65C|nr:isopeptide-forming domain-containing fimbrial protein [Microbacterium resistens]MBW1638654.1 DUF11 domain-containing protein [Microbacterium resistens]
MRSHRRARENVRTELPPAARRGLRLVVAGVVSALLLSLLPATAAMAAPVYEIAARWADGTPTQVATGQVVSSEWRVNVNDDAAAPSNDPVDDVTFTVHAEHAKITALPDVCLVAGVTPASSISADGSTLTCNLGTQDQGSAHVVQIAMQADGQTGDSIVVDGAINGETADLSPIAIVNPFAMDMVWQSPSNYIGWGDNAVDIDVQWTLFLQRGSDPGPDAVTYTVDVTNQAGAPVSVGPQQCSPFSTGIASGHPWSGPGHPADQTAPFPASCTITPTGVAGRFLVTISGIDYSQASVPTRDSLGQALPADRAAVASGSIWLRFASGANNTMTLTASAPTYVAPSGATSADDPANNQANKTWTRGGWANAWQPEATGITVPSWWSAEFRVSPGTEVQSVTSWTWKSPDPSTLNGQCMVMDTRFVDFLWAELRINWGGGPVPGATMEYYVGNDPTLDPASAGYDPNVFQCASDPGGWTTTLPADLSTVKAVRATYPSSAWDGAQLTTLNLRQRIKDTTPIGQDVWEWGAALAADGTWTQLNRSMDPADQAGGPLTPGARYPFVGSGRDMVRIIGAIPDVVKSVDRSSVRPGVPATYSLTYSANGTGAIPPTVDDFALVDTLPVGMSYVAGSASPEPQVAIDGQNRQVLTWSLDGVPTNTQNVLTYEAVADAGVTPGSVLTNSVVATLNGETSNPARADVVTSINGRTDIGKTTDQWFIANPDGSGDGEGSWTVTLRSQDPLPQAFTDTIDILPYNGDGRGTSFSGTYEVTSVGAPAGATVYYTTADPATLSDDPRDLVNGAAPGDPTGNTSGWSTTAVANATAIRVITGELAPGAVTSFTVDIATDAAQPGDVYMNRAQAVGEHTELVMRTSEPLTMGTMYSASLKKYVMGADGEWHDANDVTDYPTYRVGDRVPYRIVIENTGQGTLRDLEITDDLFPEGSFTVDELAPGATQSHEFTVTLTGGGTVVNTACGAGPIPDDSEVAPTINCDPAGVEVVNYTTVKSSDPASGATVKPGDTITYTVTVTQEGDVPAIAEFTDTLANVLDDAVYNGDVTASIGTATVTGDVLSWNGTVPVGEAATITYSVTVKDSAALAADGDYRVGNQVTSPGCVEAADCATEHPVADYTVVKSSDPADGSNVAEGDTIAYTLTVSQVGEGAFTGASLTDDLSDVLDDATWNGDLTASAGTAGFDPATATLAWSGDLAVGQVVTITYSVTVTAAGDTHLHNVVTSDGCASQDTCETEHFTATYTTVKTSDPAPGTDVKIGDVITYTVTVTQSGEGRVVGQFFTDDLANVLDDAVYNDDLAADNGTATYDPATGVISWTGDLGPGDVATVTYSVTVTAAGDTLIGNTVQSPGCESAADCETEHKTGRYETVKTSDPASGSDVQAGDVIEYTVTVSQVGEAAVAGASFTDDLTAVLDDAAWNDDLAASAGTVSYGAPTVTWSGDLKVGQVVTVTYSVTVTGAGDMTLRNVVTSDGCADEGSCTTTHQTGDYTVSKTAVAAPGSTVAVGDTITYTVTVAQRGPGAVEGATFVDDLTAVLDDATWNDDAVASAGTASFAAGAKQLTWTGDLAVGEVVTVTYSVTVTGAGDMTLTNVVAPGENGECVPAGDQNPDCTTTHQTGRFTYSKMADPAHNSDVRAGDVVTYTVTVAQEGPASVAASLVDDLSDVIDDADYNGDVAASAGTAAVDGATLSWSGDLAPGDVVTITYSVTVTGAGNTTLANVVTSPSPAGECVPAPDGTEDCRTIHKTGGYVYAKTADPASGTEVALGDRVTYTLTVAQRGDGAVADAIVVDDLSDVLDDASWNDDATASSGAVTRAGDTLTWKGDLAVGQTVTVTYSVTVTSAGPAELRNVVTSPDVRAICDPAGVCETEHEVPPTPPLAITGGVLGWGLGVLAGGLLIAGAMLIGIRRRRQDDAVTR